jgi:hypothetical protein
LLIVVRWQWLGAGKESKISNNLLDNAEISETWLVKRESESLLAEILASFYTLQTAKHIHTMMGTYVYYTVFKTGIR